MRIIIIIYTDEPILLYKSANSKMRVRGYSLVLVVSDAAFDKEKWSGRSSHEMLQTVFTTNESLTQSSTNCTN